MFHWKRVGNSRISLEVLKKILNFLDLGLSVLTLHSSVEYYKRFWITYFLDLLEVTAYCFIRRHILEDCEPQSPSSPPSVVINSGLVNSHSLATCTFFTDPASPRHDTFCITINVKYVHGEYFAKHDVTFTMFYFLKIYIFIHVNLWL